MAMKTATRIQRDLDHSREHLLELIEALPDEALLRQGTLGRFSIADFLAHLAAWEAELVTGLMRLDQGKKPEKLLSALSRPDVYNARRYLENQGRDLDSIFDDFQGVRVQLESWLEDFSDRDLNDPKRYKWFNGKPLAQVIADTTYEIEKKYMPGIAAFAHSWLLQETGEVDLEEAADK